MKILKKIALWIILSFIFQFIMLFYINNFFLTDTASIKSRKIVTTKPNTINNTIKINIPQDATNVKPSFDGKYLSYILDSDLVILNTKTSKIVKVIKIDGKDIDYYKWMSDRNRILYLHKEILKNVENLNIEAYDVDNNLENKIDQTIHNYYKGHVKEMTFSPGTNIIYVNFTANNYNDTLYWINIMGDVQKINIQANKINKMFETQKYDNLVYESSNNIIHILKDSKAVFEKLDEKTGKKIRTVKDIKNDILLSNQKYSLIGIDSKDNIYIGRLNNGLIDKIYYGALDKPIDKWNDININMTVNPDMIFLAPKNDRLYRIGDNGYIIDILNNKKIIGSGEFIAYSENYFEFKENNTIILKKY